MKVTIDLIVKTTGNEPPQLILEEAVLEHIRIGEFKYTDWQLHIEQADVIDVKGKNYGV